MINRYYHDLDALFHPKEVLIIYGPRRVGKTTLVESYLNQTNLKYRYDTGDNIRVADILSSRDLPRIQEYVQGYELIVIDEAQMIPDIGLGLKLIIDHNPNLKVIATGSSSFSLSSELGEPLTDRKTTITLYPISQMELLKQNQNMYDLKQKLSEYLIYGSYPKIMTVSDKNEKIRLIEELVNSYIFKDILLLEKVKGAKILLDLLKLLAFQIGSEVSLNELATSLGLDVKTIARYLDLLEKSFVIYKLTGFSRNLRSEVSSKAKYYFLDNGVRNGVISQYNSLEDRNDIGQLWENFIMMERLKKRTYLSDYSQSYFWRTYEQKEIDLIEEKDGILSPYEIKWSNRDKPMTPQEWIFAYPQSKDLQIINRDNYLNFVT